MVRGANDEIVLVGVLYVEALNVVCVRFCSGVYRSLTLDFVDYFIRNALHVVC